MALFASKMNLIIPKMAAWNSVRSAHTLTRQAMLGMFQHSGLRGRGNRGLTTGVDDGNPHTAHVVMPSILDSTEGKVLSWLKAQGDTVSDGESLCQVEVGDMIIEISAPFEGVLADIIAENGQVVKTSGEVAVICDSQESFQDYLEAPRLSEEVAAEEKVAKPSGGLLLREVKHMLDSGKVRKGEERRRGEERRVCTLNVMSCHVMSCHVTSCHALHTAHSAQH